MTATQFDPNTANNTATATTKVNNPPVANNDSYSTPEDTFLNVAAPGVLTNDTDPDSDPLTAVLVAGPINGTLALNANGSFLYTPNANFNGIDSFTYKANDGAVNSNVATVSITVTPVNDAPVANGDNYSVNEDNTLTVVAPGVLGNDTNVEGNTLTAVLLPGPPINGTLTLNADGSFTYIPNANYNGVIAFMYKANDGAADSNPATVVLTVNAVNDVPVANAQSMTTSEDTAKAITLTGSDVEGASLSYNVVTQPTNGTLSGTPPNLTYTPNANYNGVDSFTFTVNDGSLTSAPATVSINVTPVNDAPTCSNVSLVTAEDTVVSRNLAGDCTDPDVGDTIAIEL
ncbi:MAG: Ig-like domain-containing protein, partial [Chloroflexota bacterium]